MKTFNVGANGSLKLSNVAGDVRVTGGSGTEIRVEAKIHGKGSTDAEARAQFDSVKVDMRQNGSRVDVETTHERHSRAWVDYTVVVPTGASIDVHSVSGDVQVSDVGGSVRAETVSGDVTASGAGPGRGPEQRLGRRAWHQPRVGRRGHLQERQRRRDGQDTEGRSRRRSTPSAATRTWTAATAAAPSRRR